MIVPAIRCPKCKDIIFSRARHDFHWCSCKSIFIDGGFDYLRYGGVALDQIQHIKLKVSLTKQELYDDWNKQVDLYGIISASTPPPKGIAVLTTSD